MQALKFAVIFSQELNVISLGARRITKAHSVRKCAPREEFSFYLNIVADYVLVGFSFNNYPCFAIIYHNGCRAGNTVVV